VKAPADRLLGSQGERHRDLASRERRGGGDGPGVEDLAGIEGGLRDLADDLAHAFGRDRGDRARIREAGLGQVPGRDDLPRLHGGSQAEHRVRLLGGLVLRAEDHGGRHREQHAEDHPCARGAAGQHDPAPGAGIGLNKI
jgi:hypothetical protein